MGRFCDWCGITDNGGGDKSRRLDGWAMLCPSCSDAMFENEWKKLEQDYGYWRRIRALEKEAKEKP